MFFTKAAQILYSYAKMKSDTSRIIFKIDSQQGTSPSFERYHARRITELTFGNAPQSVKLHSIIEYRLDLVAHAVFSNFISLLSIQKKVHISSNIVFGGKVLILFLILVTRTFERYHSRNFRIDTWGCFLVSYTTLNCGTCTRLICTHCYLNVL